MLIRSGSVLLKNGVSFVLGIMQYMAYIITPPLPLRPKALLATLTTNELTHRFRVYQTVGSSAAVSSSGRRIMANTLLPSDLVAIVGYIVSAIILWVSSVVVYLFRGTHKTRHS
jgi:hypothetical protein